MEFFPDINDPAQKMSGKLLPELASLGDGMGLSREGVEEVGRHQDIFFQVQTTLILFHNF